MNRVCTLLLLLLVVSARTPAQAHSISLDARNATLNDVIFMLAAQSGKNLVADGSIRPSRVTLHLRDVSFDEALDVLARTADLQVRRAGSVYLIGPRMRTPDAAGVQVAFEVRVADVLAGHMANDLGLGAGAASYALSNTHKISAFLDALITEGGAKILAASKIVTSNNREGDILIGQAYPVFFSDAKLGTQTLQFVDVGVKLRLTPTIGIDGSVTVDLQPEYSAIEALGDNVALTDRKIESTLRVREGETIVLGGLLNDIDAAAVSKMPFLGDVAVLGTSLRERQRRHARDEIVFLITPHVLGPSVRKPRKTRGGHSA